MFSTFRTRQAGTYIVLMFCALLAVPFFISTMTRLAGMIDPDRLVQVSSDNIFDAILFGLLLYVIASVLLLFRMGPDKKIRLFTLAFILRVAVGVSLAFVIQYDDERGFHYVGLEQQYLDPSFYESWSGYGGRGYYQLVSGLYAAFGPNILLPKMVNAVLGALLPFLVYDIARHLFSDLNAARRALLFSAFLPPLVLYSALNLKEIGTAFLLTLVVWFLILPQWKGVRKVVGVSLSIGVLYWLRGATWAAISITSVITYVVLGRGWTSSRLFRPTRLVWVVCIVSLIGFVSRPVLRQTMEYFEGRFEGAYFITRFAESEAAVMQYVDIGNPLSPGNLGILFLRGIFSPSPLRFVFDFSIGVFIEAIVMAAWYVIFPLAMVGFLCKWRRRDAVVCGVIILLVMFAANAGAMVGSDPYRHRLALFPVTFALAGGGFDRNTSQRFRGVIRFWWIGVMLFTVFWLRLRL